MAVKDVALMDDEQREIDRWLPFFEQLPCASYIVRPDSDFTLVYGNALFYKLLNCSGEEVQYKYGNRLSTLFDSTAIRDLCKQAEDRSYVGIQHRIRRREMEYGSGNSDWLFTRAIRLNPGDWQDASPLICCASVEVSDYKNMQAIIREYDAIIDFVTDRTNFESFRYDLKTRTAKIYAYHKILTNATPETQLASGGFCQTVMASGRIMPEYRGIFREAFDKIHTGQSNRSVCEIKMLDCNNQDMWVRLSMEVRPADANLDRFVIGIVENITQQKQASLTYLNEAQFYQAMISEKEAFAHMDVDEDRITRIGGMWNLYNEIINKVTYTHLITEFINKVVHPEDRAHYLEVMQCKNFVDSLENGIDRVGCEFRRIVEQNKMMWMQINVHLFRDPFTKHVMALAYLTNIDAKKKQEFQLKHAMERDYLTNIYNKRMAEETIREHLKNRHASERCAIMLLDVDNLKSINDKYGYQTGDQLLVKLVRILSRAFRKGDVIGRLGGDEFIIFLRSIGGSDVKERLEELYKMLAREKNVPLQCSIGVTVISTSIAYEDAFLEADLALIKAKKECRNSFSFYGNTGTFDKKSEPRFEMLPMAEPGNLEDVLDGGVNPFSANSVDAFLSEQGDMAYLVDPDNFDLIWANKSFYDRLGITSTQCIGMKCYEAVHRRTSPCPFCGKANWSTDKFYIWRNLNLALEQEFIIKNKLVMWQGKEALLAFAIDVSNDKSIVGSMAGHESESHGILSGIQRMSESETLETAMTSALETIGYFFGAGLVAFWEKDRDEEHYTRVFEWCKNGKTSSRNKDEALGSYVNALLKNQKSDKPIPIESCEAMLCHSFDMYQVMKRNNTHNQRWVPLKQDDSVLGWLVIENITMSFENVGFIESFSGFISNELKKRNLMEEIIYASSHDDLTNLLNRNSYDKYIQSYEPDGISAIGVMVADLNGLNMVNARGGVAMGDKYIRSFANMLLEVFSGYAVFRLNGDEFMAVVLNEPQFDLERKVQLLNDLLDKNSEFSVSIGQAWDDVEKNLLVLIDQANQAMKVNKKRFYDSVNVSTDDERRKLLNKLVSSIENREYEVYLQPKMDMVSQKLVGAEALIRYNDPERGVVAPNQFIPMLERNHFIRYVDLFVFEEVCRLLEKWVGMDVEMPVISLNFSRLTLLERDILPIIETIASKYRMSKKYLEIEITESFADTSKSTLYQVAKELYAAGFSISLDDFGTKYTNLSILSEIDFDVLKLDRSLIMALDKQESNQVILKNIVLMCNELSISVIAEGVETVDQQEVLKRLGCSLGQGYLYGKPTTISDFQERYMGIR